MPREPMPPARTVAYAVDSLSRLVRNLLIDNVNFRSTDPNRQAHVFAETPRTADFVSKTLRGQAESILERLGEVRTLAMDMAADADIPGLHRVHSGRIHDRDVRVAEDGREWLVSISVPDAFHGGDDVEARFPDESAALEAVRSFRRTGNVPEAFEAVPEPGGPARR